MIRKWLPVVLILSLFLTGCKIADQIPVSQNGIQITPQPDAGEALNHIRIAQQFGVGYASMTIADELGMFEKFATNLEVTWIQMGSIGAIKEAFKADEIDAAIMDIPSFLTGWDEGISWKVASGISVMPVSLQTNQENINSLSDFSLNNSIAIPAEDSLQHILLSMAAEKELGSPTALDGDTVMMTNADAEAALIDNNGITGHFAPPPYNFEELESPGIKKIYDGTEAFGADFSSLVLVASTNLYENNPRAYAALVMAFADATDFINENPEEAARILQPSFGVDENTALKYLTWPGMDYVTTPLGLMGFSEFMKNAGYLTKVPGSISDIAFSNVVASVGEMQGESGVLENLQYRP